MIMHLTQMSVKYYSSKVTYILGIPTKWRIVAAAVAVLFVLWAMAHYKGY